MPHLHYDLDFVEALVNTIRHDPNSDKDHEDDTGHDKEGNGEKRESIGVRVRKNRKTGKKTTR